MMDSVITNRSLLVYKKRRHITYKGYWLWGESLRELILLMKEEIEEDLGYLPIELDIRVRTICDFEKWMSIVNNIYIDKDSEYTYFLYININDALKRVKENKGEIYVDYNKTFNGDCLKEE